MKKALTLFLALAMLAALSSGCGTTPDPYVESRDDAVNVKPSADTGITQAPDGNDGEATPDDISPPPAAPPSETKGVSQGPAEDEGFPTPEIIPVSPWETIEYCGIEFEIKRDWFFSAGERSIEYSYIDGSEFPCFYAYNNDIFTYDGSDVAAREFLIEYEELFDPNRLIMEEQVSYRGVEGLKVEYDAFAKRDEQPLSQYAFYTVIDDCIVALVFLFERGGAAPYMDDVAHLFGSIRPAAGTLDQSYTIAATYYNETGFFDIDLKPDSGIKPFIDKEAYDYNEAEVIIKSIIDECIAMIVKDGMTDRLGNGITGYASYNFGGGSFVFVSSGVAPGDFHVIVQDDSGGMYASFGYSVAFR